VQRRDPSSLLAWFERLIRTVREIPEAGAGTCRAIDEAFAPGVFAHRADGRTGSMAFLHNLAEEPVTVDLSSLKAEADHPNQVFGDQDYDHPLDLTSLRLDGYGYRWIRLARSPVG
jgi:maltose alpha-D-glucosyltransferase/alpha-amylase